MIHLADAYRNLDRAHARVLTEMHPDLAAKWRAVQAIVGPRFALWCGFRGQVAQEQAFDDKTSGAHWLESPHNYRPCLGIDAVLDPRHVKVRPSPADADWPDLWDPVSPDAVRAWADLEAACAAVGLNRVSVQGRRDVPHMELPDWHSFIPKPGANP